MSVTLRCVAVLTLGLALLSPAQQRNQQTASPGQSTQPAAGAAPGLIRRSEKERRQENLAAHEIVLNVLVRDAAGKAVRGLAENNFTILDDGKAQPITFFRPAQPPHVVLMLDGVNGSHWSYAAECRAVEKYLRDRSTALEYPVAIGLLSPSGISVNLESQDPKTLLSQVEAASGVRTSTGSEQQTVQDVASTGVRLGSLLPSGMRVQKLDRGWADKNRRFVVSVNALTQFILKEESAPGRIVVLWVGVGWPLLTGPGFLPDTAAMKDRFFDRIAALSNGLREAQVTLNAIASPELLKDASLSQGYYAPYLAAATAPGEASAANLGLPVLAVHSGGEVLDQDKDMAAAIAKSLAGIDSWYTLAFQSLPSSQPDEYRPLEVRVNRPGAVVRTNTGYYAQP